MHQRRRKNHQQLAVTCVFPPPQPDDEPRHVALLKQLIAIGRPVAEREDALIGQLRMALAVNDVMLVLALCRELCAKT